MRRSVRVVIIVVAVVVVAYPLEAALSGLIVEHQIHQAEQRALQQSPYLSLTDTHYHYGVYEASEEATFALRPNWLRADGPSWQITVHHSIHHGPLPQGRAFALASIDTQLVLPPAMAESVRKILGDRPPLQLHTTLGWLGGYRSELTSPAFQAQLDGGTLVSQGVIGTVVTERGGGNTHVQLSAPGFSAASEQIDFGWTGLSLDMNNRLVFGSVNAGGGTASLKNLKLRVASGEGFALDGVSFDSASSVDGEFMGMQMSMKAKGLQSDKFTASNLDYEFALDHLHGPSLAVMADKIRTLNASGAADPTARAQQMMDEFKTDGVEVLLRDPVMTISRFGFETPDGKVNLSARLTAPGMQRTDFNATGAALMIALAQRLQVTADVSIDQGLIDKLTASNPNASNTAAQLGGLENQGYIKRDGTTLSSHIEWASGKVHVNGKVFPPGAPAP